MRQLIHISLLGLLLSLPTLSGAQQLFNNEFAPFEMRKDAEQRNREVKEYYMELTPQIFKSTESTHLARHIFTLPDKWTGRTITLHIENAGAAYDLVINNREVLANEDEATPTNINITKYLAQGENVIDFTLRESSAKSLQEGAATTQRVHFEGSYLSAQPYTHIHDFEIKLSPDSTKSFAYLDISVMVRNDFSAEESVDVGFDIYDPSGKLLDYSVDTFTIQAGAVDTIKFTPAISGKKENWWSTSSPKLHKVMIYTRRNGVVTEYVPRSVGLLDIEYKDGKLYNFGTPQQISIERYNAAPEGGSC
ncbi:MAG: sugar-binding domain-containing protein, partial [Rikenellaceae bacterium]